MTDRLAYTVNEALEATGLGRTTLYRLIAEGKLKAIKVGERTLIPAESLRSLIDNAPHLTRDPNA